MINHGLPASSDLQYVLKRIAVTLFICGTALALSTGCASDKLPTFSDDVAKEGAQYSAISKKWSAGQELIAKGEKRIKKGRKQINDGNENLSEGEKMIRRGNQMVRDSEQEYKLKKELSLPSSSEYFFPVTIAVD